MPADVKTVGFVGLGKMGAPMVRRLLGAGFDVVGANRSQGIVAELAREGMIPAADAATVGERAEVIMTALPDETSVEEVAGQLLGVVGPGKTMVEHSTISPPLARSLAARYADRGAGYLDAPVSGGPAGAEAGKLTVMAGGDPDLLAQVTPVLAAFGDPIRNCGGVGAGQAIKLVNQLLVGIHTSAAAEAAAFGAGLGIEFETIAEVIGTSFGSSAMLARNLPRFTAGDYRAATPVSLLRKDLSLIQGQADDIDVTLRLGRVARELFDEAAEKGMAGEDMAALFKLWSEGPAAT
jgi:3-hydroxyisobutyrate dehydrogenase-like beta-hydroxyacid dehydrogenase